MRKPDPNNKLTLTMTLWLIKILNLKLTYQTQKKIEGMITNLSSRVHKNVQGRWNSKMMGIWIMEMKRTLKMIKGLLNKINTNTHLPRITKIINKISPNTITTNNNKHLDHQWTCDPNSILWLWWWIPTSLYSTSSSWSINPLHSIGGNKPSPDYVLFRDGRTFKSDKAGWLGYPLFTGKKHKSRICTWVTLTPFMLPSPVKGL